MGTRGEQDRQPWVRQAKEEDVEMTDSDQTALPMPTFAGGTTAITTTPIVGTPGREYAEVYVPGEEDLEDGELRVTVLGSGNPWVTRAQSSASILVEIGNPERDLIVSGARTVL
jgi:ribonuclease Z